VIAHHTNLAAILGEHIFSSHLKTKLQTEQLYNVTGESTRRRRNVPRRMTESCCIYNLMDILSDALEIL
jgi:hypothetical protein